MGNGDNYSQFTAHNLEDDDVSTGIELNKREGEKISIKVPFYGGGMSFGSVSLSVMLSRAKAAEYGAHSHARVRGAIRKR
jgi:glutamate synthase domain-containing protein 2